MPRVLGKAGSLCFERAGDEKHKKGPQQHQVEQAKKHGHCGAGIVGKERKAFPGVPRPRGIYTHWYMDRETQKAPAQKEQ